MCIWRQIQQQPWKPWSNNPPLSGPWHVSLQTLIGPKRRSRSVFTYTSCSFKRLFSFTFLHCSWWQSLWWQSGCTEYGFNLCSLKTCAWCHFNCLWISEKSKGSCHTWSSTRDPSYCEREARSQLEDFRGSQMVLDKRQQALSWNMENYD